MSTYARLRAAVFDYLSRGLTFDHAGVPANLGDTRADDPMQVGNIRPGQTQQFNKGKQKGKKGFPKGKSKGATAKGKPSGKGTATGWWMRPCSHCGGKHMDTACRSAQSSQQQQQQSQQQEHVQQGTMPPQSGRGAFQGQCHKCGTWGHKSFQCRRRVTAVPSAVVSGVSTQQSLPTAPLPTQPELLQTMMEAYLNAQRTMVPSSSVSQASTAVVSRPAVNAVDEIPSGAELVPIPDEDIDDIDEVVCAIPSAHDLSWTPCHGHVGPVMSVSEAHLVLVDSGSFIHSCPVSFCSHIPIEPAQSPRALVADGSPLEHFGTRTVVLVTAQNLRLRIKFHVTNVSQPILSVGLLVKNGHSCRFGGNPYLRFKSRLVPLVERNNLYYLPVRLPHVRATPAFDMGVQALRHVDMVTPLCVQPGAWSLVEWACSSESLLAEWMLEHDQCAIRLGLPTVDLSQPHVAEPIVRCIEAQRRQGRHVFLWAALPCRAWSTWQYINQLKPESRQRILQSRQESMRMLEVLHAVLKTQLSDSRALPGTGQFFAAFEWPRFCTGWRLPIVQKIRSLLQVTCEFDGCEFGLENTQRMLLRKPWRVVTNFVPLQKPLSKQCQGDHLHGQTRGLSATRSAYYTPSLVDVVGRAILGGTVAPVTGASSFSGAVPAEPQQQIDAAVSEEENEQEASGVARQPDIPAVPK